MAPPATTVPAPVPCSVEDCGYVTPKNVPTWEIIRDMLQTHASSVHAVAAAPSHQGQLVRPKPAPVSRPEIDLGASEHDWRFFQAEFDRYKRSTGISGTTVLDELWHCQAKPLHSLMQAEASTETLITEALLLEKIKSLAVVTLHSAVHLVELRNLQQGQNEPIRKFVARARNIATSCNLSKKCTSTGCTADISFLDETVFGVVLAGLRDSNIQQKILSLAAMKTIQKLEDLITYVAAEESGYKDIANIGQNSSTIGGVRSTYQKENAVRNKCLNCGGPKHGNGGPEDRAKSCSAYGKSCNKCGKRNHLSNVCKSKPKVAGVREDKSDEQSDEPVNASLSFFGVKAFMENLVRDEELQEPISTIPQLATAIGHHTRQSGKAPNTVVLPHSVHSVAEGWLRTRPENSPTHEIELSVDKASYMDLGLSLPAANLRNKPSRRVKRPGVFDTGAQLNLTNPETIHSLGYEESDLLRVSTNVNTASNTRIDIMGGIIFSVKATNRQTGVTISCKQLFYVSSQVNETYLSKNCCTQLQTIPTDFPSIGSCHPETSSEPSSSIASMLAGAITRISATLPPCTNSGVPGKSDKPCQCPRRSMPPSPPSLPCEATEENLPILKQFILDTYSSSAFNTCSHQPLPMMTGSDPLRLYVDPSAKPVAIRTPSQVPLHWKEAVKEGLERDCRLGVLEKVPENTPDTWCSRMVVTPKPDGTPRRVIDYQEVNKSCPRQTHHTETPWALVSAVPANTRKSVVDAWHGYHSVEIDPEDRHVTTFLRVLQISLQNHATGLHCSWRWVQSEDGQDHWQ